MRNLSPFPHKCEISDPHKRIALSTITDEQFLEYIRTAHNLTGFDSREKIYKKYLIQAWMNYMFGAAEWDFEDGGGSSLGGPETPAPYRYWICTRDESILSVVLLRWA